MTIHKRRYRYLVPLSIVVYVNNGHQVKKIESIANFDSYPEIGDANFMCQL